MPDRPLVIEAVSVEAIGPGERFGRRRRARRAEAHDAVADERVRMYCDADEHDAGWRDAGLFVRERLRAGAAHRRPGDHRRGQRHHGGRARLAGAGDGAPARSSCSACARASRATPSAPRPTR